MGWIDLQLVLSGYKKGQKKTFPEEEGSMSKKKMNDIRLIFSNCELFNEDDSLVGKAGHVMRSHFEARWAELTSN